MTRDNLFLPAAIAAAFVLLGFCPGFPVLPFSVPLMVLLYPVGTACLGVRAPNDRQAFLYGLAAAGTGHAIALFWLRNPMSIVGGLPMALAILLTFVVCLLLATQAGLFAVMARHLWQPDLLRSAVCLGLCWYFLEYAYALVIGFPWLPLSGALILWPWTMQAADTFGAYLASSFWLMAAFALYGGIAARKALPFACGLVLALCLSAYGLLALAASPMEAHTGPAQAESALPEPPADNDVFPVLMADGNIDQNQKWVESYRRSTVAAYDRLTSEALEKAATQKELFLQQGHSLEDYLSKGIIIWSETAMPFDLPSSPYTATLSALARRSSMGLVTGAPGYERDGSSFKVYNRIWLINAQGRPGGFYDKEHLVPFGEYIPSFFRLSFLDGLLQGVGAYTEGTKTAPLKYGRLALGPLVCYEAIFPWLAQDRCEDGANVLLDVSNDGWFGATAAPWQHLYLAGLRCLEQNRWLVRCTNTGISAVFDNHGRLVFEGPQFTACALWASARIIGTPSRFHGLFYILPAICGIILIGLVWSTRRKGQSACNS